MPTRGLAQLIPITRFCAKEHRARVDGRATARHLHGMIERAVRCYAVKVSAESAGAVASNVFLESLTTDNPTKISGRLAQQPDVNLMVVLAHLQGVAATFRVGRHHTIVHRSMKVGASLTPSLTSLPLTSPSPQRYGEEGLLQAAALAPVVETGESEDVWTRVRLNCDSTGLYRAQIWRRGTQAQKQCEIWAQFRPNPLTRYLKTCYYAPLTGVRALEPRGRVGQFHAVSILKQSVSTRVTTVKHVSGLACPAQPCL